MWAMSYGCSTITFSQLKQKTALGPIIVKESDIFPIIEKPPLCVVPLYVIGSVSGHFSSFFIFTIFRLIHNLVQQSAPFAVAHRIWILVNCPGCQIDLMNPFWRLCFPETSWLAWPIMCEIACLMSSHHLVSYTFMTAEECDLLHVKYCVIRENTDYRPQHDNDNRIRQHINFKAVCRVHSCFHLMHELSLSLVTNTVILTLNELYHLSFSSRERLSRR